MEAAVIGWMFSDDCCALNKQQKSELLCSLFNVRSVQAFNSFEVKVEHHDIDILIITDNDTCWVIENKVKSSQHSNQLDKYYNIIKGEPVKIGRKIQSIQDYMQLKSHYCFLTHLLVRTRNVQITFGRILHTNPSQQRLKVSYQMIIEIVIILS